MPHHLPTRRKQARAIAVPVDVKARFLFLTGIALAGALNMLGVVMIMTGGHLHLH